MPEHIIHLTDADRTLIERVQEERGLPSLEAAAEWLIKTRLRRAARTSTGRGRALYLVDRVAGTKGFA
ncbi:hypothetical protein [Variovorax sp. OV700]|uniref:hypothetical protein n=1 Tax=Variovorax sp. OV700 TaxID=1882826 RepID=UPI0008925B06|nr:hypothetical protein [Variovorax sp. OV700]SDI77660.1 hypothetical protein SAMN05444748_107103 [Variovorax sp. OV700]